MASLSSPASFCASELTPINESNASLTFENVVAMVPMTLKSHCSKSRIPVTAVVTKSAICFPFFATKSVIARTAFDNLGTRDVPICSPSQVRMSLKFDHNPHKVFDCASMRLANFPPSLLMVLNAFVTSTAEICPFSIIFWISAVDFQSCWESTSRSGTPASVNCRRSSPVSFHFAKTCP